MIGRSGVLALAATIAIATGCSTVGAPGPSPAPTQAPTAASTPAPTTAPTATPTAPPTVAPSPTAPPYVLIKANDVCTITSMVERHENGNVVYDEHFSCQRTADDPRVSGQLEFDVVSVFEPMGTPVAHWTTDNYTLTNDGGTWQGKARGTVAIWEDIGLRNYGRADYVGKGGYAGLQFVELIAATDSSGLVLGYITGS